MPAALQSPRTYDIIFLRIGREVGPIKTKRLLLAVGIGCCVLLALGLIAAIMVLSAVSRGIDGLKSTFQDQLGQQAERDVLYQSVLEDLVRQEPDLAGMVQAGIAYDWGMETPDWSDKYYFFLPDALRPVYCAYWLEGVDPADYREGLNRDLAEYGDPVFWAVNISELSYLSDVEYGGAQLAANETYYLAALYDEALYYRYVSMYQNEEQCTVLTGFRCDGAPVRRYLYHREGDGWARQELTG